jgi:hypothetical protein
VQEQASEVVEAPKKKVVKKADAEAALQEEAAVEVALDSATQSKKKVVKKKV